MDNDLILRRFEELEQKVNKLIDTRNTLEKENLELKDYISELEKELQAKVDAENVYIEEKTFIRSKVDGLLGMLDERTEERKQSPEGQ